jgi:hypothetical protein
MRFYLFFLLFFMPVIAFAGDSVNVQPAWTITAASIMAMAMQILKHDVTGALMSKVKPWLQPVLIALIGQIGAFIEMLATGKSFKVAAVEWLFVSGGAMALYDTVLKPVFKK